MDNTNTLPTIEFVGGETQPLTINMYRGTSTTKTPLDLDGYTAHFAVISHMNLSGTPIVQKDMMIALGTEGVLNLLSVILEPADTVDLCGKYIYQITFKDSGTSVGIPKQGVMKITENIDKSFIKG